MRLHSLTIDNVRAIDRLEIADLPASGVIVIHGDNEQGKSTILDALDALFTIKHTGSPQKMKDFQPVGRDEPPAVSATMTIGPYTFSVFKQWLRRKKAELKISAPRRESFTGGEAEDKLAEILDEHLDKQLLQTLFLRQGDLGDGIAAAGIPSLQSALAGAENDDLDGEPAAEDDALLHAIEREYQLFYTAKSGKPTKRLEQVDKDHERAAAALEEARSEVARLDSFVEQVETHERSRDEAADSLPDARAAVKDAEQKLADARRTEEKAAGLRQHVELATRDLEAARARVTERSGLRERLEELTSQAEELRAQADAAQGKAEEEHSRVAELTDELDEAKKQRTAAQQRARAAAKNAELLRDLTRRDELRSQLADIETLEETLQQRRRDAGGRRVTDEDVDAVQQAANDLAVATALHGRTVPKLQLSADPDTTVTVDGEEHSLGEDPHSVDLTDGATLRIGDVTAVYHAGSATGADAAEAVDAARTAMDDLLADLDCDSLEQVRTERDRCVTADAELADAQKDLDRILAGRPAADIRAELDRLADAVEDADVPEDLDTETAADAVQQAEHDRDEAEQLVDELEHRLEPWRESTAATDTATLQARREVLDEQITRLRTDLEAAVADCPDETLTEAVDEADAKLAEARAAADEAEQKVAEADPQLQEDLLRGAQARVESLAGRHQEATLALARLTSYIDQAAGAAERLQQAVAEEETASRLRDSIQRRAAAAARLREVVKRHHQAARSRYAQPFADELTALSKTVFGPEVDFSLSDDLAVRQRSIGDVTVPLASLSGGAKEQLAILTRFAVASLISRGGSGEGTSMPVVIDDALGSTDPTRLQRMSALFDRMGRSNQVIVLTCFPQRYDWVADKTQYPITELKSAGK
jgi:hypothetical protein